MQLTSRSRIGSVVGIIGALAISCQGSSGNGCITGTTPPYEPPVLLTRYVLVRVLAAQGTAPLPVPTTYGDSAGFQLRVDADTLFFNTDLTYRESGQTTLLPSTGSPTTRPHASGTPAPRYVLNGNAGTVQLPTIMGRVGTGYYYGQTLNVNTTTATVQYGVPVFYYEAR